MGVAIIVPNVSFADANLGKVNISGDVPVQALRIVAEDSYIGTFAQLSASFFPITTTQRGVVWSIVSGSEYASIDNEGLLTIKRGASYSDVTVRVRSVQNPSIYAEKALKVSEGGSEEYKISCENDGSAINDTGEIVEQAAMRRSGPIEIDGWDKIVIARYKTSTFYRVLALYPEGSLNALYVLPPAAEGYTTTNPEIVTLDIANLKSQYPTAKVIRVCMHKETPDIYAPKLVRG